MTKAAPITAATICATSRVRFGPMVLNRAIVSATATAPAARPERRDHPIGGEPAKFAGSRQDIDERRCQQHAHQDDRERHCGDSHREHLPRGGRRRKDEIEVGARVECAGHRFHRLRQHQRPCQQQAAGDHDQGRLVGIEPDSGETADHGIGDDVHEDREYGQCDRDSSHAPAPPGRHHGKPVPPCQAGTRCCANQVNVPGWLTRRLPARR